MSSLARAVCFSIFGFFLVTTSKAFTLQDLQNDTHLSPQRFMEYFSDFQFKLGEKQQPTAAFLSSKCGDCDDFSILAASVLAEKGYTTQIIVISMDAGVHAVCYVAQDKAYLDYNNRLTRALVPTDGSLADIGKKVAASFKSNWHSASQFEIAANGARHCLKTELR